MLGSHYSAAFSYCCCCSTGGTWGGVVMGLSPFLVEVNISGLSANRVALALGCMVHGAWCMVLGV